MIRRTGRGAAGVEDRHLPSLATELPRQKTGDQPDASRLDERAEADSEAAARRKRVSLAAAVHRADVAPAHRPGDRRPGFGGGERQEIEQRVERGVSAPHDQDGAWRTEHGRGRTSGMHRRCRALVSPMAGSPFVQRVRRAVRPGGVDDGPRQEHPLAGRGAEAHLERRLRAAGGLQLVAPGPRDGEDARGEPQVGRDLGEGGQRPQILGDQLAAGRQRVGVGLLPAGGAQHGGGDGIDVVPPRREDLHVAPAAHVRPRRGSGLQDDEGLTARGEVRAGGEADGAGADDGDRPLALVNPWYSLPRPPRRSAARITN
jgi:hypothetical protein